MNSYRQFENALCHAANLPALISGIGKSRHILTFAELERKVDAVVATFRERGLRPGDKVLLALPPSTETYVAMLALLKAGMVIMHIDPAHGTSTVARILRNWPPEGIVASKTILMLGSLFPELRRIPRRFVVRRRARSSVHLWPGSDGDDGRRMTERFANDAAILSFTSGSTGEPKALIRSHGFLGKQLEILGHLAPASENEVDFVAMPMFVLFNLANSVTSVLPACNMKHPGRADPAIVLNQLRGEPATRMVASPALLERLADYCLVHKQQIPAMRCISTGGGPVGPSLPQRLRAIAPNAIVRTVFGSTEAEPIASIDDHQVSAVDRQRTREGAGLLVGNPVRGCAVRIVRSCPGQALGPYTTESFSRQCLADGSVGEIVVSGEHVIQGYADSARDRDSKIRVHDTVWHRTGDAGYFDDSGRLWLVGRCAAALQDYRGTVYPFQVEYAVNAVRGVRRAALVAGDGDRILVVETSGREFRSNCAGAAKCVAKFGIDRIVTVPRIPVDRRHDAKVDYPALRRLLDGPFQGCRNWTIEMVSHVFTYCRDGCKRLQAQALIYTQRKH